MLRPLQSNSARFLIELLLLLEECIIQVLNPAGTSPIISLRLADLITWQQQQQHQRSSKPSCGLFMHHRDFETPAAPSVTLATLSGRRKKGGPENVQRKTLLLVPLL